MTSLCRTLWCHSVARCEGRMHLLIYYGRRCSGASTGVGPSAWAKCHRHLVVQRLSCVRQCYASRAVSAQLIESLARKSTRGKLHLSTFAASDMDLPGTV